MTLEWKSYTDKKFSLLCNLPDSLQSALGQARQQHYEELYEPEAESAVSLQNTLDEILQLFQGSNQTLNHLRYVWMALILTSVVEPTVQYYQPKNWIPEETINWIVSWLLKTLEEVLHSKTQLTQVSREEEANIIVDIFRFFSKNQKIASFQILSEALNVYSSAIKTLDYNQSLKALLDILDDCLEGYAIFPGSYGRRELFDWWLLDVVPASWYLLPPSSIYSIDKLENGKNIAFRQMDKLQKISYSMWNIILRASQKKENQRSDYSPLHSKPISISLNVEFENNRLGSKRYTNELILS